MSRATEITQIINEERAAYQVFITPSDDSVKVIFADDHTKNDDLRFPPVVLSHSEFFEVIPHNENTQATFQMARERGDTYGLFVSPMVISRLARRGLPGEPEIYQHTVNRQFPTEAGWQRASMMDRRV